MVYQRAFPRNNGVLDFHIIFNNDCFDRRLAVAITCDRFDLVFVLLELDEGSVFREAAAAFGDFDLDLPRVLPSLLVLGVTLESRRAAETKKSHAVARRRMCQKARQGKMRRGHKK